MKCDPLDQIINYADTTPRPAPYTAAVQQEYDDLTHLAAYICGTPFAALYLMAGGCNVLKSYAGPANGQMPEESYLLARTLEAASFLQIPDTATDEHFVEEPLVASKTHIRFYAGLPILVPEARSVGILCVYDTAPRQLDQAQQDTLCRLRAELWRWWMYSMHRRLTHARPYKEAWLVERVIAEITAQSGKQFDKQVVNAFLTLPHAMLI